MEKLLRINLVAWLRLAAEVASSFWRDRYEENRANRRHWISISSTAGLRIYSNQGQGPYGAANAALNMATAHMAVEFKTLGVRANVVAPNSFPSIVATEDVASAIVELDKIDMTGQVVIVDCTDTKVGQNIGAG